MFFWGAGISARSSETLAAASFEAAVVSLLEALKAVEVVDTAARLSVACITMALGAKASLGETSTSSAADAAKTEVEPNISVRANVVASREDFLIFIIASILSVIAFLQK